MASCLEIRETRTGSFGLSQIDRVKETVLKTLRAHGSSHPTLAGRNIVINLTNDSEYAHLRRFITTIPSCYSQNSKMVESAINLPYFELIEVMDHFFSCDENAEDFLPLLQVLAENDPLGFVCLYSNPSRLSSSQALPLMTLLAKEVPKEFAERYHNFPKLSFEQALPLLRMIAERAPYSFLKNLGKLISL
jgi:hypothetical protein